MGRAIIEVTYIDSNVCFECGAPAVERHHVVPHSLGGTKTVPLCSECHAKVHGIDGAKRAKISELTKKSLEKKKQLIKTQGGFYNRAGEWVTRLGAVNPNPSAAIKQSALNRVARAKANPINIFFWKYVTEFETREGRLSNFTNDKYQKLADELNALGHTTMTGLPYTINRCKALVDKMRKRFLTEDV